MFFFLHKRLNILPHLIIFSSVMLGVRSLFIWWSRDPWDRNRLRSQQSPPLAAFCSGLLVNFERERGKMVIFVIHSFLALSCVRETKRFLNLTFLISRIFLEMIIVCVSYAFSQKRFLKEKHWLWGRSRSWYKLMDG